MKQHHLTCTCVSLALLACAAGGNAAAQTTAPQPLLTLYQRVDAGRHGDILWLALEAGAWRVGAPDGPPATSAQLRSALTGLQGVRRGGDVLAAPAFAGVTNVGGGDAALGWVAVPAVASDRQRWLGLIAPERYVGLGGTAGWRLGLRYRDSAPAIGEWLVLHGAGSADATTPTEGRGLVAVSSGSAAQK